MIERNVNLILTELILTPIQHKLIRLLNKLTWTDLFISSKLKTLWWGAIASKLTRGKEPHGETEGSPFPIHGISQKSNSLKLSFFIYIYVFFLKEKIWSLFGCKVTVFLTTQRWEANKKPTQLQFSPSFVHRGDRIKREKERNGLFWSNAFNRRRNPRKNKRGIDTWRKICAVQCAW